MLLALITAVLSAGGSGLVVDTTPGTFNGTNSETVVGADCYSNIRIGSDGNLYTTGTGGSDSFGTNEGAWLLFGTAAEIWVEVTITGGSPGTLNSHDPTGGRLQLSSNVDIGIVETTTTETHTCIVTVDFWNASAGGLKIATDSWTLSATENSP